MKRLFIFLLLLPTLGFCTTIKSNYGNSHHLIPNVQAQAPHYLLTQYHRPAAPGRFHGHDKHLPDREHTVHAHRPGKDINVHHHRNKVERHTHGHITPGDNHNQNQNHGH